jgi:hypothetical protein
MKKLLYTACLLLLTHLLQAQFNNEWIDYSKTYYKIKVATTGLYRLSKSTLDAAGIGNGNAQDFQLWRNGAQVPLFTSIATGPLSSSDFIEFYGERNDGKIDRALYLNPANHLTDKISLFTDTAIYFLTINTAENNLRWQTIPNNITGNPAPASNIWTLVRHDYQNRTTKRPYVNKGTAVNYGEYVYSSAYDRGEMLSSDDIYPDQGNPDYDPLNRDGKFTNLLPYTGGSLTAKLRLSVAGSSVNARDYRVMINSNLIGEKRLTAFEARVDSFTNLNPSMLSGADVTIALRNLSTNIYDRFVSGFAEIEYPRLPDAAGQKALRFYLPASAAPTYLEISNMVTGGGAPVLYNLTTGERIVSQVDAGGKVKLMIPALPAVQQFYLVNEVDGFTSINSLTQRNFVNYGQAANQGDYIIISNRQIWDGSAGNAISQYAQYRSSAAGGGYNGKVFDIEQLVDQFAFGVKMHPLSIKNFLRYARQVFTVAPKYCFLIGKGVNYGDYREKENHPDATKLLLVPTFGYPASDNLLASNDLTALTATPIGRLNAVSAAEVNVYLNKVKEYDANLANPSQSQQDKLWMKNIVHVVGANDAGTASLIAPSMETFKQIIQDTLYGGKVTTFNKFNSTTASTIENDQLAKLFKDGFSLLTYFGHSSATALDYNLEDPSQYDNPGKYPVFLLNGCNAGNFYDFDAPRLNSKSTISEKYVLAENRGAICMIASTHFGIVNGLALYSNGFYQSVAHKSYNQSLGKNIQDAIRHMYQTWGTNDFSARIHSEQQTLHGDPAIVVNSFAKPDYSVEAPNVVINPSFLSISETEFKVKIHHYNLGKAINDSITVEVKRQYPITDLNPGGLTEAVYNKKIKAPLYEDSLELTLQIFPQRDKGINKIIVSVETEQRISEISETNNTVTKEIVIYEDDLRTVYPYNYSIVNKQGIKLIGSTSNPFSAQKTYRMELDTTEMFNSSFKVTRNVNSIGGIIEFDPGITFTDSTVYYWRLAVVPTTGNPERWNNSSFVYLPGTETGYNQSHLYQHTKSTGERIYIDSVSRTWQFRKLSNSMFISHSVFGTPGYIDDASSQSILLNSNVVTLSACIGHSIIFNVFDPITLKPMNNYPGGLWGSGFNNCGNVGLTRQNNFEWNDQSSENRKRMVGFMDSIPNGSYVVVRKILDGPYDQETYADKLKADQAIFGVGNTLYDRLKSAGFAELDSFNRPRTYIFVYKKNDPSFQPRWILGETEADPIQLSVNIISLDTLGYIKSPLFGPAKTWKQALWRGNTPDNKAGDNAQVEIIGVSNTGIETRLFTLSSSQQNFDISSVNATTYPYMRLRMRNADSVNGTAYNLRWWRLYYTPVPEGALAGNLVLQAKDTLELGEPLEFKIAFKNISETAFADSLLLKAFVTDKANVTHPIQLNRKKALVSGDTTIISFTVQTAQYPGLNTLYLAVNPDNDQPEQFFFNNFLYKNFFVREDKYNPLLDVTFDGVHILNRDIVSSQPHIQIKLKDENMSLALNDTAGLVLRLKYPGDQVARAYKWGTDTLQFTPAIIANGDNTATIDFLPILNEDSENTEYELTVSGKDRNGNRAGNIDYRISFQVFNKPMISNLLNYPNPFSTSTAFVFTITGSEVPQEFKIQILSITGKIVKEITKQELGDIRIGTNITEYKWDGTDTYGQKLANGVYLYRVISSLDGKQMDRFRLNDTYDQKGLDVTDQYFKKGYGKMVILR